MFLLGRSPIDGRFVLAGQTEKLAGALVLFDPATETFGTPRLLNPAEQIDQQVKFTSDGLAVLGLTFGSLGPRIVRFDPETLEEVDSTVLPLGSFGTGTTLAFGLEDPPPMEPGCANDVTGDGRVDLFDLLVVIFDYGCTGACPGDATGDGVVDYQDLFAVLAEYGCGFDPCDTNDDCDDGDPCTFDWCTGFGCINFPIPGCP